MMDEMANHATRIRRWIDKIGVEKVEDFIDRALSLENLIDHHSPLHPRATRTRSAPRRRPKANERVEGFKVDREYMRGYINPPEFLEAAAQEGRGREAEAPRSSPSGPQRDVLLFLLEHAPLEHVAARHPLHPPRRGLLLRAAGPDEDHERGLGQLLALARS